MEWSFCLKEKSDLPCPASQSVALPSDVQILCDYMPYPVFDSSDWGDNRDYCNYCTAYERLTCVDELSLLYCDGDSASMLLVTPG